MRLDGRMNNAMYKIGVVGPDRSVEKILLYAKEYDYNMSFIAFSYTNAYETLEILREHHTEIDFWLFSGYIPYTIAQESEYFSKERMEYIFITDHALYRGLLEKCYEIGKLANSVSIDILNDLKEYYSKINNRLTSFLDHVYIKQFSTTTSIDEIVDYHKNLWNEGKIDVVITVYPTVEERLNELGIPVYWTGPLKQDIFHTLQVFFERIQTFYYKDTQTTALVVQVRNFNQIELAHKGGYKLHYLQLGMKHIILQLCEVIDGYLIEEGNGGYIIFSSRGIIEKSVNPIFELIDRLSVEVDQPVIVGIGSATTVYYAENYARQALQHLIEKDTNGIVVMEENGTIKEFGQELFQIEYTSRVQDIKVIETLQQTSVSTKMFAKIEATLNWLKIDTFSAKILAKELNMTDRNAQRIISELAKTGLVEHCGEESRNTRGRPAKLYKLSH